MSEVISDPAVACIDAMLLVVDTGNSMLGLVASMLCSNKQLHIPACFAPVIIPLPKL